MLTDAQWRVAACLANDGDHERHPDLPAAFDRYTCDGRRRCADRAMCEQVRARHGRDAGKIARATIDAEWRREAEMLKQNAEPVGQPFTVSFIAPPAMLGNDAEIARIDDVLAMRVGENLARLTDGRAYHVKALPVRDDTDHGGAAVERTLTVIVALQDWRDCEIGEYALNDVVWATGESGKICASNNFVFAPSTWSGMSLWQRVE